MNVGIPDECIVEYNHSFFADNRQQPGTNTNTNHAPTMTAMANHNHDHDFPPVLALNNTTTLWASLVNKGGPHLLLKPLDISIVH